MKKDIKNYTLQEMSALLKENNLAPYIARQIFNWIYAKRIEDFGLMTDISKDVRVFLTDNFYFSKIETIKKEISSDKTIKFLFKLEDSSSIESVLIPEGSRFTLCVSTQVGCKYGCEFCLSGIKGLKRNLTAAEIINQYLYTADYLVSLNKKVPNPLSSGTAFGQAKDVVEPQASPRASLDSRVTNLVFMGTGEPLDNLQNTIKSINIFTNQDGLNFGKRRITLSTCGVVPGILELADSKLGVKLSVSLHSADNDIRSKIMPVNRKYPLDTLMKSIKYFSRQDKYPVTFEYALIGGVNTSKEEAHKLIRLLKGLNCKINLIPYNLSSDKFSQPSESEIETFCKELKSAGLFFTLRKPRGQDIHAACGQLHAFWN